MVRYVLVVPAFTSISPGIHTEICDKIYPHSTYKNSVKDILTFLGSLHHWVTAVL